METNLKEIIKVAFKLDKELHFSNNKLLNSLARMEISLQEYIKTEKEMDLANFSCKRFLKEN